MNTLFSRRHMLKSAGCGFGYLALAGISTEAAAQQSLAVRVAHHPPRVKRVIFLFMHGGPSHVDTFDYKPELQKRDGERLPFAPAANLDAKKPTLMASPWKFAPHGESGMQISELFPHVATHADELCVINSLHSKGQSHGQAVSMLHTGTDSLVRPSLGAWVGYGLGTENNDLPSFITIGPPRGHGGARNYGSAFLPAAYQGTAIGHSGMKVEQATIRHLENRSISTAAQQRQLRYLQAMNRRHLAEANRDTQIEGVIEAYELAFRMQSTAPQVMDISDESPETLDLYGCDQKPTAGFARQCLLARRFAEAGVRYIQVSTSYKWDQHGGLEKGHTANCLEVDQPIAALLTDLRRRGMLDDTLVVWGGEFGRTPIVQGSNGRDHNPQGFTMWLAGGGVRGGLNYGATDEFGYYAQQDKVHMHDLHATILHMLGLDHERLTYRFAGRDFRLTDVYGRIVQEILA